MPTYYISTTGNTTSNNGSIGAPWDILGGFNASGTAVGITAGDTIYLRAGTYSPTSRIFPRSIGTSGSRVTYLPYPGEVVKVDGKDNGSNSSIFYCYADNADASNVPPGTAGVTGNPINGYCQYTDIIGLEVYNSVNPKPSTFTQVGFLVKGARGVRIRDCYVHDCGFGIELLAVDVVGGSNGGSAFDCEAVGNVVAYSGKQGGGNDGHGFYAQCNLVGSNFTKWLDNVSHHHTSYDFHGFPHESDLQLSNVTITGNCFYGGGLGLFGSPTGTTEFLYGGDVNTVSGTISSNYLYSPSTRTGVQFKLGLYCDNGIDGVTMQSNRIMGQVEAHAIGLPGTMTITSNVFSNATDPKYDPACGTTDTTSFKNTFTSNTYNAASNQADYAVARANPYTAGRGHVYILNETAVAASVGVDLSPILAVNDTFELRHASSYGTVAQTGTYVGGNFSVTMTGLTVVAPLGGESTPATYGSPAKFAAFVVIKTGTTPPNVVTCGPSAAPLAYRNVAYTGLTLVGAGGTSPYTFAVTAGALPTGLTLSGGVISGTVTAAAALYNFTITATDNVAVAGTRNYDLRVIDQVANTANIKLI